MIYMTGVLVGAVLCKMYLLVDYCGNTTLSCGRN